MREDKRVQRTQQQLANALISLILEKGYESISIVELTERAEVGYATFFRHYKSKDVLLRKALGSLVEGIAEFLPHHLAPEQHNKESSDLFRYIEENETLSLVLFRTQVLYDMLLEQSTETIFQRWCHLRSSCPLSLLIHHTIQTTFSLAQWWLENKKPLPPDRMGEIYDSLVIQPIQQFFQES